MSVSRSLSKVRGPFISGCAGFSLDPGAAPLFTLNDEDASSSSPAAGLRSSAGLICCMHGHVGLKSSLLFATWQELWRGKSCQTLPRLV